MILLDMARNDYIYQDISSAYTPSRVPTRSNTRVHINWIPSITAVVPLTPYCSTSIAEVAVPRTKTDAQDVSRSGILFRSGTHNGRLDRPVDEMVFGRSRSVAMGNLLGLGREDAMESTLVALILDRISHNQRGWLESTAITIA